MYKMCSKEAEEPEINLHYLLDHKKSKKIPKKVYFCYINYAKAFDCVDNDKLWKILKEMGIPDHPTCLLRNLYAGQATVRTRHGTMDWFQIGKGVHQGCILSLLVWLLCRIHHVPDWKRSTSRLYIVTLLVLLLCRMQDSQAGIKLGRNTINLR